MNIGLMTWFQFYNYGTALQLTALSKAISGKGNVVKVINYHTRPIKENEKANMFVSYLRRYKTFKNPSFRTENRNKLFESFYRKNIVFSRPCEIKSELELLNQDFDCFVCGSDQIWNPANFDSHYYLDYVFDPKRMIAYAPSLSTPSIENDMIKEKVKYLVQRFDHLSVREENGARLIRKICGKEAEVVLDPALLLDRNEWDQVIGQNQTEEREKYILVYMLGDNNKHWAMIENFSKKLGMKIRIVPVFKKDLKRSGCIKSPVGPEEFVNLIKNADYVLTDSFHGVVFSIIYGVNFNVFERFSNANKFNQNERIYNILKKTGLEKRLVGMDEETKAIDYSSVYARLRPEIKKSKDFLFSAIDSINKITADYSRKKNIKTNISVCCGCGACVHKCRFGAIKMERTADGFWESVIDSEKCTSCGACLNVCPMINNDEAKTLVSGRLYSYKDKRNDVLAVSSSGGAAYALAEIGLKEGRHVIGCTYNQKKHEAEHIAILKEEQLAKLQGSKYMQSNFHQIMTLLSDSKQFYWIFGLPCQIAAAKKIHGDNAFYVDLICHGVPSYNLFSKYLEYIRDVYGITDNDINIKFRDKSRGWRERYIYLGDCKQGISKSISQHKDPYFAMFIHGICYSKSCYECPWRDKSMADIRIGDYWGPKFANDTTGVSMLLTLTDKGKNIIPILRDTGLINESDTSDIIRWQQSENHAEPLIRDKVIKELSDSNKDLRSIAEKYAFPLERAELKKVKSEKIIGIVKKIIGYKREGK